MPLIDLRFQFQSYSISSFMNKNNMHDVAVTFFFLVSGDLKKIFFVYNSPHLQYKAVFLINDKSS